MTFDTQVTSFNALVDCIYKLQTAHVSEKSNVFTFSHSKAGVLKFDLAFKKKDQVNPGSSFKKKTTMTRIFDAT